METIVIDNSLKLSKPFVATIGFFDGVHLGHKHLIDSVILNARKKHLESMVITFDKHPRLAISKEDYLKLLTTNEEKLHLLSLTGIDLCAILNFNYELSSFSAKEFMRDILFEKLNVKVLIIGYDNRFGHERKEGFLDYVKYGKDLGIEVIQASEKKTEDSKISSSLIRSFLKEGSIREAENLLGHPYYLDGKVIEGTHLGRKIGFPTANIQLNDNLKLIPALGAYAVKAKIEGFQKIFFAMMNIGKRPTFGENEITLEVHILDFNENLYGKNIHIRFIQRLRGEKKFSSANELKEQLFLDKEAAIRIFED